MIYLTQLIYVKIGQEETFHRFEEAVIPILKKCHGEMLARFRPTDQSWIAGEYSKPYEVHVVGFDTKENFEAFAKDETRKSLLPLKEASIDRTVLIEGRLR